MEGLWENFSVEGFVEILVDQLPCVFGEEAQFGISRMRQPADGTQLYAKDVLSDSSF
jgi:hypothetical protein